MQNLAKYISVVILLFCISHSLFAQEKTKPQTKVYDTWITLKDDPDKPIKGILYEINDSSISIANSLSVENYLSGKIIKTTIRFENIDKIKIRRSKIIGKGVLVGAITGYVTAATFTYTLVKGEELAGLIVFEMGFPFALLGAGTGAILGSIKDKVTIKGSFENFDLNRSTLQDYSYVTETVKSKTIFKHRGFGGAETGLSFPFGDLKDKVTVHGNANYAKTGYNVNVIMGYRFTKNLGICFNQFDNDFSISKEDSTSYWMFSGIVVGPILSVPLNNKVYFDFKPGIGYANALLVVEDKDKKDGDGLGLSFNVSLMYNFSNQWGLMAGGGYYYSHQKFDDKTQGNYQAFNLNVGVVYRFSRKSL